MEASRGPCVPLSQLKFFFLFQGQAVFPLYSAGVCVAGNCRSCPYTYRTLLSLRTFISSNSLGSAGFWLLGPGATLGSCYGPTNTRLRCHLGKMFTLIVKLHVVHILKRGKIKLEIDRVVYLHYYIKCAMIAFWRCFAWTPGGEPASLLGPRWGGSYLIDFSFISKNEVWGDSDLTAFEYMRFSSALLIRSADCWGTN